MRHRSEGNIVLPSFLLWLMILLSTPILVRPFLVPNSRTLSDRHFPANDFLKRSQDTPVRPKSPSALSVWWFGGTEEKEAFDEDSDSCELVAVRIERTSPNSRRIAGEITIPTPINDVWAILTDYNRLSTHVPNLVESKIIASRGTGSQGDGQYTCRLYQKGAQKIIGFEFGADVTMDMQEKIVVGPTSETESELSVPSFPEQRKISFKCYDSLFFSEFDGEWNACELTGDSQETFTKLSYVVDVRPKGPVPVAALEWRIREDVPTNLRAVKLAATTAGEAGVLASRKTVTRRPRRKALSLTESVRRNVQFMREPVASTRLAKLIPNPLDWSEDETMAAYLKND